jgi:hypothetical protein
MTHKVFNLLFVLAFIIGLVVIPAPQSARAASLPKVAVYAADFPDYTKEVVSKLTATGLYSQVDNLSPSGFGLDLTPTLATLQQYAAVMVYSNWNFNDPNALGNVLADYVDGGGHVVVSSFAFLSSGFFFGHLAGRFVTEEYLPITQGTVKQATQMFLIADLPSDPLLAGISSFDGGTYSYHNNGLSLTNGATLVAHWTDGEPLVAFKGNVVALNFFPPSSDSFPAFWNAATDGVRLMTNALNTATRTIVAVDIKPGNKINRIIIGTGDGTSIQVGILSATDFDARRQVDWKSLTFGSTGNENSLRIRFLIGTPDCLTRDVNHDGLRDLVCRFLIGKTGFQLGDTIGILKGKTMDGTLLEGHDSVIIMVASYPSYPSYP